MPNSSHHQSVSVLGCRAKSALGQQQQQTNAGEIKHQAPDAIQLFSFNHFNFHLSLLPGAGWLLVHRRWCSVLCWLGGHWTGEHSPKWWRLCVVSFFSISYAWLGWLAVATYVRSYTSIFSTIIIISGSMQSACPGSCCAHTASGVETERASVIVCPFAKP